MHDEHLLDHYVAKLIDCLAQDKIFPPHPKFAKKYEQEDIRRAQETLTAISKSKLVMFKQSLIWLGLRISSSFINVFCPPPHPTLSRRFLVNPEKLADMITGDKQPLRYEISRFVCSNGRVPLHHFVATCFTHWYMRMPWLDYQIWAKVSPNAPSKEIEQAARRRVIKDNTADSSHHHYLDNDHQHQQLLTD